MRIDIDDDYSIDDTWGKFSNRSQKATLGVHELIFSGVHSDLSLNGREVIHQNSDRKIERAFF